MYSEDTFGLIVILMSTLTIARAAADQQKKVSDCVESGG